MLTMNCINMIKNKQTFVKDNQMATINRYTCNMQYVYMLHGGMNISIRNK